MARGEQTPQEKEAMKVVSARLNGLISAHNIKQKELSEATSIPTSTLSGYMKGSSLPIAGNIQKLADYFGVKKSAIDPRFETSDSDFNPEQETNDIATLLRQQIKNQQIINDKLDKIIQFLEKR